MKRAEWSIKRLADVCDFQRGLTYPKSDEVDFSANVVMRANNVDLASHTLNFSELRYITDEFTVPPSKKLRQTRVCVRRRVLRPGR